jgi:hypothetical protein
MVDCAEFLDSYSDFRDGRLAAEQRDGCETHMQLCTACARYDRVVGGGVQVFRSLPPLCPSPDFQDRLLRRLYAVEGSANRHASGASLTVTVMICIALGAGAWLPALRPQPDPVRLPAIVAHAPYHDLSPVLMRGSPPPLRSALFESRPAYHGQGYFLDSSAPLTALAYRPTSAYYLPR